MKELESCLEKPLPSPLVIGEEGRSARPPAVPFIDVGEDGPAALIDVERGRWDDLLAVAQGSYGNLFLSAGDRLSRTWLARENNPYLDELDSLAARIGTPGVYLLNLSYEWFCTTAVAPDPLSHGSRLLRALDWSLEGLGRNVVVARQSGPEGPYLNITWPGFIGVVTAMAPGRFAAALNQAPSKRRGIPQPVSRVFSRMEFWRNHGLPPAHLLREVFEQCQSYEDAKRRLSEVPLNSSTIFILSGVQPDEGCVIQRVPNGVEVQEGPECVTNHWLSPGLSAMVGKPDSYERRNVMDGLYLKAREGFDWLVPPVLNPSTRVTIEANAAQGRLLVQGWEENGPATEAVRLDVSRRLVKPGRTLLGFVRDERSGFVKDRGTRPQPVEISAKPGTPDRGTGIRTGVLVFLRDALKRKQTAPAAKPRELRSLPWKASYPKEIDWDASIPEKPLHAVFDESVDRFPNAPCIDFLGRKYTYRQIGRLVDRVAKGFQNLGVRKGAKVGLLLPNTPYFPICYYAGLKAGATIVSYNPLHAERELINQIRDSETEVMVTLDIAALYSKLAVALPLTGLRKVVVCSMPDVLPFPKSLLFSLARRKERVTVPRDDRHVRFEKLIANDGNWKPVDISPREDIAVLQYTGGTTGIPKGAVLTHANLYCNAVQTAIWFPPAMHGGERTLGVLPFFHAFGMSAVMNRCIYVGGEIIALPRFDLKVVLKAIDKKKPSVVAGVPSMFTALMNHKEIGEYDFSSVRYTISGGAALPQAVKRKFENLTGCEILEGYGLTETSPVVTCNPPSGTNKEGSIGLPLPRTVIEITSLGNPNKILPQGATGEICIRGPQVMTGYWRNRKETEMVLRNGRLRTGDVGYMDEDGYTFLIDRIKDVILVGGYNVYPRNVEEAILLHPAVEEVCVCGIPNPRRGHIVKAFVKQRADKKVTERELLDFLKDKLAPYERPKQIEFRDSLPKTTIGKPSRENLITEEVERLTEAEAS